MVTRYGVNDMDRAERYDSLRLSNQLCFPLYAAAKEVVRNYKPFLDPLDLTYTQYLTMLVLWERREITVKELGELLWLDSGTLTPVLKKLESKGCLLRRRSDEDERSVILLLTDQGEALREKALSVPPHVSACVRLSGAEAAELCRLLNKILAGMREDEA